MTQEQFTRAVEIASLLSDLKEVKDVIRGENIHLTFINKETGRALPSKIMSKMAYILDNYTDKIRCEIDKEIESFNKEISEL